MILSVIKRTGDVFDVKYTPTHLELYCQAYKTYRGVVTAQFNLSHGEKS